MGTGVWILGFPMKISASHLCEGAIFIEKIKNHPKSGNQTSGGFVNYAVILVSKLPYIYSSTFNAIPTAIEPGPICAPILSESG